MCHKSKKETAKKQKNSWSVLAVTYVYLPILILIGCIACYFSYAQKREEVLSNIDFTFRQLEQSYNTTTENFLQLYLPIFENGSDNYVVLYQYFSEYDSDLSPVQKSTLNKVMNQMINRENQVQWIALYSDKRSTNYILYKETGTLQPLPKDFPYLKELQNKSSQMEVYGMEPCKNEYRDTFNYTYAISGGIPKTMGQGSIIAGYATSSFESITKNYESALDSLEYVIFATDKILYNSKNNYDEETQYLPKEPSQGSLKLPEQNIQYLYSKYGSSHTAILSYKYSTWELLLYSHKHTFFIILIVFLFVIFSNHITKSIVNQISKEVSVIRNGLIKIGENQLAHQIPANFRQPGLNEIADSINQMTLRLTENINRAYFYELKQKESELSELQAKFNPHFLYNSLEMIRSRCYQHGDVETSELISQLSAIFRGFINAKTFIPLPEELAFSRKYLTLFAARYDGQVNIQYEIDSDLMEYGIIRNVFQPLIENYFIHGFDTSKQNKNYIRIIGKSLDDNYMVLIVEDNGCGMTSEKLEALNASLQEPIQISNESYGLKNLSQRIRLFYGEDCGITIFHNKEQGLSIKMILKKLPYTLK